jgi:hypothetical protein
MKCVIIGAGATAFCDIANPDRRPPLVSFEDFSRLIDSPTFGSVLLSPTGNENIAPFFSWAVREFSGDIEELFTCIFWLRLLKRDISDEGFLQHVQQVYGPGEILNVAHKMHECGILWGLGSTSARNILKIFSGALLQELRLCLGTTGKDPVPIPKQPISNDHRKIARMLDGGDVIISFNYDWVMPYALLNEDKLSHDSFENPYFKKINIPSNRMSDDPIRLVTPHGSFTWFGNINNLNEILVNFEEVERRDFGDFGVVGRIILPYKCKEKVYQELPVFDRELAMFLRHLSTCNELLLIGKQFNHGDQNLATIMAKACAARRRRVTYVNPDCRLPEWVEEHNRIFNADTSAVTLYFNLESYLQSL